MKLKWEIAVYEHKAALIGRSPAEVANSVELLVQALLREHEIYQADYLTVGLDVYNLEAEALGAALVVPDVNACPDLAGPIFNLEAFAIISGSSGHPACRPLFFDAGGRNSGVAPAGGQGESPRRGLRPPDFGCQACRGGGGDDVFVPGRRQGVAVA